NVKQLTTGQQYRDPVCTPECKLVYNTDQADNRYVNRVATAGGTPETVLKSPIGQFELSPDGKVISSVEVREEDHKLMIRLDPTDGTKTVYVDADSRMTSTPVFSPDGKSIVYVVREMGIDCLRTQSHDGSK